MRLADRGDPLDPGVGRRELRADPGDLVGGEDAVPRRGDDGLGGRRAEARALGIPTVEINLEPSDNAEAFDERIYGPATETVPAFVARLLAEPC